MKGLTANGPRWLMQNSQKKQHVVRSEIPNDLPVPDRGGYVGAVRLSEDAMRSIHERMSENEKEWWLSHTLFLIDRVCRKLLPLGRPVEAVEVNHPILGQERWETSFKFEDGNIYCKAALATIDAAKTYLEMGYVLDCDHDYSYEVVPAGKCRKCGACD